jgi:hypothetical protein
MWINATNFILKSLDLWKMKGYAWNKWKEETLDLERRRNQCRIRNKLRGDMWSIEYIYQWNNRGIIGSKINSLVKKKREKENKRKISFDKDRRNMKFWSVRGKMETKRCVI